MTTELTVAICTYNRAASLADTLEHLCRLVIDPDCEWELLVIDNNCTDATAAVVGRFESRLPVRCILETRQGLSHGRNRALAEAAGELLVFTDDDVRVDPGWLMAYRRAAHTHPEPEYFGGRIVPYWPEGRPRWVRDVNMPLLGGLFGSYDRGDDAHAYQAGEMHPFGANFALRRSLFERMAPFRADLGVRGRIPGRGEEAEYFQRVRAADVAGWYLPDAWLWHRVDAAHLRLAYLYRYGVQKGVASAVMHGSRKGRMRREALYLAKGLYQLCKGRGDRFRQCVINMGMARGSSTAGADR